MSDERDPFLEAVLSGEVAPDAPELKERLARDPEFAKRLEDSRRAQDMLRAAKELEREVRAEAETLRLPSAEDGVRRLVLERAAPERRRARLFRPASIAAAAVVLVVGSLWLGERLADDPRLEPGLDPTATLGSESGLLHPVGTVEDYDAFAWSDDIPGLFFHVVIYDENGVELDREENLTTRSWQPSEERRSAWPDGIRWNLEAFVSVTDTPWVSPVVSASRSR